MDYLTALLPVLFHRIGLILAVVATVLLVLLPYIFSEAEDEYFSRRVYRILLYVVRTGLLLLLITGSIRLLSGIPVGFLLKFVAATLTIIWGFAHSPEYHDRDYLRYFGILLILLCFTAMVGIFL